MPTMSRGESLGGEPVFTGTYGIVGRSFDPQVVRIHIWGENRGDEITRIFYL